jgi:hypothetical protein
VGCSTGMDDGDVAGVLRGDGEVDEMRHDAEMSNVRSACSCYSWNGSGVCLELRRVVAASGDDVCAKKLREEEGHRRQGMRQRARMKGKARGRARGTQPCQNRQNSTAVVCGFGEQIRLPGDFSGCGI